MSTDRKYAAFDLVSADIPLTNKIKNFYSLNLWHNYICLRLKQKPFYRSLKQTKNKVQETEHYHIIIRKLLEYYFYTVTLSFRLKLNFALEISSCTEAKHTNINTVTVNLFNHL